MNTATTESRPTVDARRLTAARLVDILLLRDKGPRLTGDTTDRQDVATMREAVRRYARHMKAGELKKAAALAVVMQEVANWLDSDAWEAMGDADDDVGD